MPLKVRGHVASWSIAALASLAIATPAAAQSQMSGTVNIPGVKTTPVGTVDFAYTHRFLLLGGAVSNSPTFLLSTGMSPTTELGLDYATATRLGNAPLTGFTRAIPPNNEFQLSLKQEILDRPESSLGLAATLGYDTTSNSGDLAAVFSRDLGPFITVLGTLKEFTDGFGAGGYTTAGGLGLQVHLTPYLQVTEDVGGVLAAQHAAALLDPTSQAYYSNLPAWSMGVSFRIPYTPHTVQLYVTNADTVTLEGASRGVLDNVTDSGAKQSYVRAGFEFDVPFSDPGRWLTIVQPPRPTAPAAPAPHPGSPPATASAPVPAAATVIIRNFSFHPAIVRVPAGSQVAWRNDQPGIPHTVTADDGSFDSGLIDPGKTYSRVFTQPGTYSYHCTPHPFMKGTVVVR